MHENDTMVTGGQVVHYSFVVDVIIVDDALLYTLAADAYGPVTKCLSDYGCMVFTLSSFAKVYHSLVLQDAKVTQYFGYVSGHSVYHHGEQYLVGTIIGMAQDFVGSNNINLLQPNGQFGNRHQGGKDHTSARYVYTCLSQITRFLFPKDDDYILNYLKEDGLSIEPTWFVIDEELLMHLREALIRRRQWQETSVMFKSFSLLLRLPSSTSRYDFSGPSLATLIVSQLRWNLKVIVPVAVVVVMACNRPNYHERTIESILKYQCSVASKFPLFISQDGPNENVKHKALSFNQITYMQHLDFETVQTERPGELIAYYKIASHYKWALDRLFYKHNFTRVIILEDDMEISSDFFDYFKAAATLIDKDRTIMVVSSWNGNGQKQFVHDLKDFYRSDLFIGLGYVRAYPSILPKNELSPAQITSISGSRILHTTLPINIATYSTN
ncbi:hypothetical protein GIB67_003384 [Kingdonia uniflora]|uniref:Alpha-1,3-mannosyl-glycoprotein 2-beta-N-acetylglucosaminyltransferase n=1 Tax=Kingdonia uniflora TaxID=39325 RepID=A0A7J7P8Z8_9MAGN|nr:hypothetical protein GIB67_003384 [Kingdonia uniflora]